MVDYTIAAEGYLGIAKETDYGTAIGSPTKYIPILSESISADTGGIFPEDIRGDRARHLALEGPFGVSGDVEFQAGPENGLGQILLGALGTVESTGTGTVTHTFTGVSTLPSYTVVVNVGDTLVRTISGCKVGTLALSCAAGEPLTVTATLVGRNETVGTATTIPSYSTLEPFKWSEAKVTVDGTVDANIESMDLTTENTLVTDLRTLNQSRLIKELPERGRVITGSMDLNFTNVTQYERFLGGGTEPQISPWTGSLKFEWLPNAGAAYSLSITLPKVRFRTDSINISGTDRVVEGIEFDALYSAASTADVIAVLVNSEGTATY